MWWWPVGWSEAWRFRWIKFDRFTLDPMMGWYTEPLGDGSHGTDGWGSRCVWRCWTPISWCIVMNGIKGSSGGCHLIPMMVVFFSKVWIKISERIRMSSSRSRMERGAAVYRSNFVAQDAADVYWAQVLQKKRGKGSNMNDHQQALYQLFCDRR